MNPNQQKWLAQFCQMQNLGRGHQPIQPQQQTVAYGNMNPFGVAVAMPASNPHDLNRIMALQQELQLISQELAVTKQALEESKSRQKLAEDELASLKTTMTGKISNRIAMAIDAPPFHPSSEICGSSVAAPAEEKSKNEVVIEDSERKFEDLRKDNIDLKRKLKNSLGLTQSLKKMIQRYDGALKEVIERTEISRKELSNLMKIISDDDFQVDADFGDEYSNLDEAACLEPENDVEAALSDSGSSEPRAFMDAIGSISDSDVAQLKDIDFILDNDSAP